MPSNIEWTDETWNPVTGCTRVSPGCDHCYMFSLYPRLKGMCSPGIRDGAGRDSTPAGSSAYTAVMEKAAACFRQQHV